MATRLKGVLLCARGFVSIRWVSSQTSGKRNPGMAVLGDSVVVDNVTYQTDPCTNVTPNILAKVGRGLHRTPQHPLYLIRKRIEDFFYRHYINRRGNPIFSVYDSLSPMVTLEQNFNSLLVPENHVSRALSESYYINSTHMLRAHTSAHQCELMRSGLDAFLVVGDVYRRDEIDSTHYPVFHQMEGVRLFTQHELFQKVRDSSGLGIFEVGGKRMPDKQETHSMETAKLLEHNLKRTLMNLTKHLFGHDIEARWVDQYFPFTHPSWELEVKYQGDWLEVLGCGIVEQRILQSVGTGDRVGWAFGLGLERLAMRLYSIPDVRLFWSNDSGFLSQFQHCDTHTNMTYKPVSVYPQCTNDLSFWLPSAPVQPYSPNDFFDIVRNVGGDLVEQVYLIDQFVHPKTQRTSHCYRIVYRHMERTLTQEEVAHNQRQIEEQVVKLLDGEIR
ncbi:hypothetical protein ACOMHN_059324 [Nucella lapillus]